MGDRFRLDGRVRGRSSGNFIYSDRVFRWRPFMAGYPGRRVFGIPEMPPDGLLELLYPSRERQVGPDEEQKQDYIEYNQ